MEYPLYTAAMEYVGQVDEFYLRPCISRQEARPVRKGNDTIVIWVAPIAKLKAVAHDFMNSDQRLTYREAMDPGKLTTLKKYHKRNGFSYWKPSDVFRRGRFNPDSLKSPYFAAPIGLWF